MVTRENAEPEMTSSMVGKAIVSGTPGGKGVPEVNRTNIMKQ
jgi:hypothetical protein